MHRTSDSQVIMDKSPTVHGYLNSINHNRRLLWRGKTRNCILLSSVRRVLRLCLKPYHLYPVYDTSSSRSVVRPSSKIFQ